VGTKVTVLEMQSRIVTSEEPEISNLLKKKMSERMEIFTDTEVIEVKKEGNGYKVFGKDLNSSKKLEFSGEKILLASGRKSNADILKVENTGVETDERGFIKVNEFLETSKENIWAMGDATGRHMFKHVANQEAALIAHNIIHNERKEIDYSVVPHAIFTYPEVAAFGLKEEEAKEKYDILVGKAYYGDVAMGKAMIEEDGFAKAIVSKEDLKILGFHIIGPYASILIQEVINLAAINADIRYFKGMHIHPALPELIIKTLNNLR
jgi:dihydrolipoamide dehydrogenase